MPRSLSASTSIAALLSLPAALAQSLSLTLGAQAPSGASDYINPSFAGFGIEPSNLFSFTGGDDVNHFSMQLLQNLADYSGEPVDHPDIPAIFGDFEDGQYPLQVQLN